MKSRLAKLTVAILTCVFGLFLGTSAFAATIYENANHCIDDNGKRNDSPCCIIKPSAEKISPSNLSSSDYAVDEYTRSVIGCKAMGESSADIPDASSVAIRVINAVILVVGIISVIFVLKGGVEYMTSLGDAGKLKKARETILYACIGLVVCALSYIVVNFVVISILGNTSVVDSPSQYTQQDDCEANDFKWDDKAGTCVQP